MMESRGGGGRRVGGVQGSRGLGGGRVKGVVRV